MLVGGGVEDLEGWTVNLNSQSTPIGSEKDRFNFDLIIQKFIVDIYHDSSITDFAYLSLQHPQINDVFSDKYNLDCSYINFTNEDYELQSNTHLQITATATLNVSNPQGVTEPTIDSLNDLAEIENIQTIEVHYNDGGKYGKIGEFELDFTLPNVSFTTFKISDCWLNGDTYGFETNNILTFTTQIYIQVNEILQFRPDESQISGVDSKVKITAKDITESSDNIPLGEFDMTETYYVFANTSTVSTIFTYTIPNYNVDTSLSGTSIHRTLQFTLCNKYYYAQTCQVEVTFNIH